MITMSPYQLLLTAALLMVCMPRGTVSQDGIFEIQSVDLQISPSSVDVGSATMVNFACTATLMCASSNGCVEDMVNITWMKNGEELSNRSEPYIFPASPMNVTGTSDNSTVTVDFVLMTNGAIQLSHAGDYQCEVGLDTTQMSPSANLTVQFPDGFLSVVLSPPTPTGVVGTNVTLTCTAMLSVDVHEAMIEFELMFMNDSLAADNGTTQTSRNYTITPVTISSGGDYTCAVKVTVPDACVGGILLPACPNNNDTVVLTVEFPSSLIPSVVLTPDLQTRRVDDLINFTCTATLSVDVTGATIVFDYGFTTNNVSVVAGTTQTNMATLSVTVFSADNYVCCVTVTAPGVCGGDVSGLPCPTNDSDPVSLTVLSIDPLTLTRLDISPYNEFELFCSLTFPMDSNLMANFSWTEDSQAIPANTSQSVSSVDQSSADSRLTSVLSVTLNSVASSTLLMYTYQCMAGVLGGNMATVNTVVTVKGPVVPNQPLLGTVMTFPEKAVINFIVSSVAYDPENYTILRGENESSLVLVDGELSLINGLSGDLAFLTATNISYSMTVQNLVIFQTYSYVIVATNTIGSTNSTLGNFTTSEAPPGPPGNVMLRIDTSASLYLSWKEPDEPNGNITHYSYSCYRTSDLNMVVQEDPETSMTSAIITGSNVDEGIVPFTNYTCSVTAFTSAGEGVPAPVTAESASAAPTGPPVNFAGISTNPTILTLSWEPPVMSMRNGLILRYFYMCENVHSEEQRSEQQTVDVTELVAYTDYTCSVRAATINGSGPAVNITARTAEDSPGPVSSLTVEGLRTQFTVRWGEPVITNGEIIHYFVRVYFATTTDQSLAMGEMVSPPFLTFSIVITGLEMYVPYNVSMTAATGAGEGGSRSVIDFTEEGVPGPVTVSNVTRINGTHITVTWVPLTLEEARGFITRYTIRAVPTDNLRKRQDSEAVMGDFSAEASSGTLGGLTPGVEYGVVVIGNTVAGAGDTNPAVLVPTVTSPTTSNAGVIAAAVIVTVVIVGALSVIIVLLLYFYFRVRVGKGSSGGHNRLDEVELKDAKRKDLIVPDPIPVERFAKHVADYHHNKDLGFEEEYLTFKYLPIGPHIVCKLPHNTTKNRFENVFPFDTSRVRLTEAEGEPGSDYINASWIDGYRREKAYIASQGPLVNTISDFWRMVWEYKTPTVVMLTELMERGVNKCAYYWPKNINEKMDLGYDLYVTLVEQRAYVEYKLKRMVLVNTSDEDGGKLEVTHYHFTAWPDHGVPADKTCMLAFIKRIRKAHPPTGPPLLVHCSAGVGRTGTFITLDTMLQRMKEENNLNIPEFMKEMRSKRVLMVQTEAQYIYIHDALAEFITCGDTSIHATSAVVYKRIQHLQTVTNHESGFQHQFELLRQVSIKATEGHCSDSLSAQNVDKNRYRHLVTTLPFNFNRVRLKTLSGEGDYINASYVDGYKHRGAFLATQSPLASTITDMWRMVWENQSKAIVMLCEVTDEDSKEKLDEEEQFPKYWPATPGESSTHGKLTVKLVSEKQEMYCTVRKIELAMDSNYVNMGGSPKSDRSSEFVVTQYHYSSWPKSGKPSKPSQLVRLIENLIKTQSNTGNNPITVMCSDGIGRTGAFICIYSVLERVKTEGVADVFQFIKSSRFQRSGLVKELDQYIFCHEVLQEFLATFDNYANF